MTDPELVDAIRAGRRGACTDLFRRHRRTVERVLYRCIGPDEEVADLVQDTFCVAFQSIHRLQNPAAVRSWLVGIAIRKARKWMLLRRRESFVRFVPPNVLVDVSPAEGVMAAMEANEALRSVDRVLAAMSTEDRRIFSMRHLGSMDLTEMADACDVSLATIKRRLVRVQEMFGALASQHGPLVSWVSRSRSFTSGEREHLVVG
jgi:RNA polymerase sigma-70 factor (ECF subfamily)